MVADWDQVCSGTIPRSLRVRGPRRPAAAGRLRGAAQRAACASARLPWDLFACCALCADAPPSSAPCTLAPPPGPHITHHHHTCILSLPLSPPHFQGNALEAYHRQVQRAQEAERRREEAERKRWEVRLECAAAARMRSCNPYWAAAHSQAFAKLSCSQAPGRPVIAGACSRGLAPARQRPSGAPVFPAGAVPPCQLSTPAASPPASSPLFTLPAQTVH